MSATWHPGPDGRDTYTLTLTHRELVTIWRSLALLANNLVPRDDTPADARAFVAHWYLDALALRDTCDPARIRGEQLRLGEEPPEPPPEPP